MSIFEIIMLICFGAAWPLSIYKSYTSRSTEGKSVSFLIVILIGYVAGIFHKVLYQYDAVVYLYLLNFIMVLIDLLIYFRNHRLTTKPPSVLNKPEVACPTVSTKAYERK